MIITLTDEQYEHAEQVARARQDSNHAKGLKGRHGAPNDYKTALGFHLLGALGEKAVSVWLGIKWDGALGNFYARDVGSLQVRTTTPPYRNLRLNTWDNPRHIFIGAVATVGERDVELLGWITARYGKRNEYWRGDIERPCYFVPTKALHDLSTLPQLLLTSERMKKAPPKRGQ